MMMMCVEGRSEAPLIHGNPTLTLTRTRARTLTLVTLP
jgi:hypothetical protein